MKKILMLGPHRKARGGISSVVNNYFDSNLSGDYRLIYIATYIDGNKSVKLIQFIKSLFPFFFYLLFGSISIVHIHSSSRASFYRKSFLLLFSKLFIKKTVLHIHGSEFNTFYHNESGLLKKWFIRKIMNLADVVIALSLEWQNDLGKIMGTTEKIRMIYNSVVVPNHIREHKDYRKIRILFMGRLGRRKGVYDLMEAAGRILPQYAHTEFVLYGDGELKEIKNAVEAKGIASRFKIAGWGSNKDECFAGSDIYVLPSYNEGLPMSVLEAMAYGLPVVTTIVGGMPEVIKDGINGFLIKPGDVDALTDGLSRLIKDAGLRKNMGRLNAEKIRKNFDVNVVISGLKEIYHELRG